MSELRSVKLVVKKELTGDQQEALVRYAYHHGWARVNPRLRWNAKERAEANRWALNHMLDKSIKVETGE